MKNKSKKTGFPAAIFLAKNRRGQEEMVGFAMIVIIVSIILLVFLGLFLSNSGSQSVESYETESFILSAIQYSTQCTDYYGYLSVKDMIFMCNSEINCRSGEDSCTVLDSTLRGILDNSWNVAEGSPVKGYMLNITSNTGDVFSTEKGNITRNSESTLQSFPKGGASVSILFNVYY